MADEPAIFVSGSDKYNQPSQIVTLGHYYPKSRVGAAKTILREHRAGYTTAEMDPKAMAQNLGWTRLINALNAERQWPLKRLFAQIDPLLEPGIALAAVPPHRAYQAFWPIRTLAQKLAANGRIDATACLVRHTTIRRIIFGGPSTRTLHRQTIRLEEAQLIQGQRVLLLDDIAKSGASLVACREILLEADAAMVQALALGRVILDRGE